MPHLPYLYAGALRLPAGAVQVASLLPEPCTRLELEIGPGRGGFLMERLAVRSDVGMLGLEIRRKWVQLVNDRLQSRGLAARAQVYAADALDGMRRLQPDGSLAVVYVHFPDPWWKKRHNKRLVVSRFVLDEVARLLKVGADLFVQTDVPERADTYEAQIGAHGAFEPCGDCEGSARVAINPYGARSHRERQALDDQIPIHRLRFIRK